MKTKRIVLFGVAIVLVSLAAWFIRTTVHIADSGPAIGFVDNYFSELKVGNAAGVLGMYEPNIPTGPADSLPRLLFTLQSAQGNVMAVELQNNIVVPKDDVACHWLTYSVARARARTVESLLLCPKAAG